MRGGMCKKLSLYDMEKEELESIWVGYIIEIASVHA